MKDPLSDVSLSNGEGFMVEESQYQYHLGIVKVANEVPMIHVNICIDLDNGPIHPDIHMLKS
jgi:hypothetical protein